MRDNGDNVIPKKKNIETKRLRRLKQEQLQRLRLRYYPT